MEEHLKILQLLLAADRYKNQIISGIDLCGIYAPFCYGCNKENENSCAVAYVNYLKEQGTDIQIAIDAHEGINASAQEESSEPTPSVEQSPAVENVEVQASATDNVEEQVSAPENEEQELESEGLEQSPAIEETAEVIDEVGSEEESNVPDEAVEKSDGEPINPEDQIDKPEEEPKKTRIRIAIARKKSML